MQPTRDVVCQTLRNLTLDIITFYLFRAVNWEPIGGLGRSNAYKQWTGDVLLCCVVRSNQWSDSRLKTIERRHLDNQCRSIIEYSRMGVNCRRTAACPLAFTYSRLLFFGHDEHHQITRSTVFEVSDIYRKHPPVPSVSCPYCQVRGLLFEQFPRPWTTSDRLPVLLDVPTWKPVL